IKPLKEILIKHSGNFPLMIEVNGLSNGRDLFILKQYRVEPSVKFITAVQNILGEDTVILLSK
ncbi:MAG TPA: hypothetical protein PK559_01370, partial [Ignavibacteriaceae bacterium]|nr:hypothetical protein [Ignavibacteriaceae bacterium]